MRLSIALRPDVFNRALNVAAVVGSLLVAINQGDLILSGQFSAAMPGKILLTYCVPYGVSTCAGVEAIRNTVD